MCVHNFLICTADISRSREEGSVQLCLKMSPRTQHGTRRKAFNTSWYRDMLCLNSGSAPFRVRIWRPLTSLCSNARMLSQFEGSSKFTPQMRPPFTCFWRLHRYYPSWPHISQDSLRIRREEKEIMVTASGADLTFKCKYWVYTWFLLIWTSNTRYVKLQGTLKPQHFS